MQLPTGSWNVNGNGSVGVLNVTSIDGQGHLTGTIYGNPIQGFWDDTAAKATFLRIINANDPTTLQIFTGYLFVNGKTSTIAGGFEAFAGSGGVASRAIYGWFAQITTT